MEVKVLNESKDMIEFEINNATIAELLREYLNKDSAVVFAAWKREHPTKAPIVKVETKGKDAKKVIKDALKIIVKELDSIEADFKKLK